MIQAAPLQARANKELYYAWLTSNGWPREVAWDEMVKEFGKPPTKQEQADAAARAQQGAQLRQTGGAIAGTLGTSYLMSQAPAWFASAPATGPVLGEVVTGGAAAGGAAAGGAAAGGAAAGGAAAGEAAAGSAAAGEAAAGSAAAGFGSVALPVAAAAAVASTLWEDGLKDIVKGRGKRDDWTNMAVDALTGPGLNMWLRRLGMPSVGRRLGSGKGKAQLERDQVRKALGGTGVLDKQGIGTLADNSTYDFGKDGSTMKWKEIDKIAAANPTSWGTTVNMADALVASYSPKVNSNLSAWYAKAAVSNAGDDPAKAKANLQHFAKQQGISLDLIKQNLDKGLAGNQMSRGQYDAYLNGANTLFANMPGTSGAPEENSMALVRPEKGQVQRVSPGMYRDDTGKLRGSATMRGALEKAYGKINVKA